MNFILECLDDASERDVTTTFNAPGHPSCVHQLDFTNDDQPQHRVVLNGSENPKISEVDTTNLESASVPTVGFTTTEEIQLAKVNTQDTDDTDDSNFSALNSQPSRQNRPHPNHELSKEDDEGLSKEDNEGITAIKEEPEQLSVEESNKEKVDVLVMTVLRTAFEDNTPAFQAISKAGR